MILEAEKSQDRSQQTEDRRADGVILVQGPAGSRPRKSFKSRVRKKLSPNSKPVRQEEFPFIWERVSLFILFRPSLGCMGPRRIVCFVLSIHILKSSNNTLTDSPRIMFDQIPNIWAPVALSSWRIKLTITYVLSWGILGDCLPCGARSADSQAECNFPFCKAATLFWSVCSTL